MIGIIDDIWKNAPIETPFGKIPTLNFEVNGDLLQACARLYWFTGDRKYLDWAIRLGDYFLLGTNHPDPRPEAAPAHRSRLRGHQRPDRALRGRRAALPEKKTAYQQPHARDVRLHPGEGPQRGRPALSWFNPQTGEHSTDLCDTWGYNYDGFYTMWLLDETAAYRDAVRKALGNSRANMSAPAGATRAPTASPIPSKARSTSSTASRSPRPPIGSTARSG